MDTLLKVVQDFMNMGTIVLLPAFITLLGLFFRLNFWKALKNGLLVGIGYEGINLAVGYFCEVLAPITGYYSENGGGFTLVDVGWAGFSAIGWAAPFAALVVPCAILLNLFLLKIKFTNTLNVDIWDYWQQLLGAMIVYYLMLQAGCSIPIAVIGGLVYAMLATAATLKLADKWAPNIQNHYGLDGVTFVNMDCLFTILSVGWASNKFFDKIPGLNKINLSLDKINEKLGAFGDSYILSFFVGILLGAITRNSIADCISIGVGVAAGIAFLPKMVGLLMEGMAPVSKAAKEWTIKKMEKDREINVGCDCALGLGDPAGIVTAPIMIPICVLIAFLVPHNEYFPMAYMGSLVYTTVLMSMCTKGNVLKTILATTVMAVFTTVTFNFMSDMGTTLAEYTGVLDLAEGARITGSGMNQIQNVILGLIGRVAGLY